MFYFGVFFLLGGEVVKYILLFIVGGRDAKKFLVAMITGTRIV